MLARKEDVAVKVANISDLIHGIICIICGTGHLKRAYSNFRPLFHGFEGKIT